MNTKMFVAMANYICLQEQILTSANGDEFNIPILVHSDLYCYKTSTLMHQ